MPNRSRIGRWITWLTVFTLLAVAATGWPALAPAGAAPAGVAVTWTPVAAPVAVNDVAVGPGGEVWITGADNKPYRLNGTTFEAMGGPGVTLFGPNDNRWNGTATRISVGKDGVAWIIAGNGNGYQWQNNAWQPLTSVFDATDIAASAGGTFWITNQRLQARKYDDPSSYTPYPINAVRIATDAAGNAWAVIQDGSLRRFVTASFQPVPGQAQDVGVGANGAVWITGPDNSVSLWTGQAWDKADGAQGRSISVGPDGSPWVVTPDGKLLRGAAAATTAPTGPATPAPTPVPARVTTRPIVALLCKYADKANLEPRSSAQIQTMLAGPGGVDEYIREQSLGAMSFAGTQTFGWFTLPEPEASYVVPDDPNRRGVDPRVDKLTQDCVAAAQSAQTITVPDGGILSVFTNGSIGASGRRSVATVAGKAGYDVTHYAYIGVVSPSLVAHELGHVFGMGHSSYGDKTFQNSVWDPMGAAPLGRDPVELPNALPGGMGPGYNAFHRDLAGWIPAARKFTYAGTQQQVTLTRLTQPTTNDFLMAQIPIGTTGMVYTVEARMFAGADASLNLQGLTAFGQILPAEAVIIHRAGQRNDDIDAWTVVAGPNDNSSSEGALWRKGKTFTDAANNVSIRVDDFDTNRGIAQVTIGPANGAGGQTAAQPGTTRANPTPTTAAAAPPTQPAPQPTVAAVTPPTQPAPTTPNVPADVAAALGRAVAGDWDTSAGWLTINQNTGDATVTGVLQGGADPLNGNFVLNGRVTSADSIAGTITRDTGGADRWTFTMTFAADRQSFTGSITGAVADWRGTIWQ